MTLLYGTAIVLPAVIILLYSTLFSINLMRREAYKSSLALFTEVRMDLEKQFREAQKTARVISTNLEITRFLSKQIRFSAEDLSLYRQSVSSILTMAKQLQNDTLSNLQLFYINGTVPEFWDSFFRIGRIEGEDWYREFAESPEDDLWLKLRPSGVPSDFLTSLPSQPSLTYVHKVRDLQLNYLGVVLASLPRESLFSSINRVVDGRSRFYLFDNGRELFYTSRKGGERIGDIDQESLGLLPDGFDPRDYLPDGTVDSPEENELIISARLAGPEYYLVYYIDTTPYIRSTLRTGIVSLFILLLGLFFLETSTYLFVSRIFSRLKAMTSTMDLVSGGDFSIRIKEEKNDEIGQIAQDFNCIVERLDTLLQERVRRNVAQKDAQLKNLQMQINPHFIYNTIDTFRMQLVMADQFDLAEQMALFGSMMRYNMSGITTFSTLSDEIRHMESYVRLQRLRFHDRIDLNLDFSQDLVNMRILRFVLQPIVENSLKHGIEPEGGIRINVSGRRKDGVIEILVEDDGLGMDAGDLEKLDVRLNRNRPDINREDSDYPNRGVGLANIHSRLTLYYGEKSGLVIQSCKNKFTRVGFSIPLEHLP